MKTERDFKNIDNNFNIYNIINIIGIKEDINIITKEEEKEIKNLIYNNLNYFKYEEIMQRDYLKKKINYLFEEYKEYIIKRDINKINENNIKEIKNILNKNIVKYYVEMTKKEEKVIKSLYKLKGTNILIYSILCFLKNMNKEKEIKTISFINSIYNLLKKQKEYLKIINKIIKNINFYLNNNNINYISLNIENKENKEGIKEININNKEGIKVKKGDKIYDILIFKEYFKNIDKEIINDVFINNKEYKDFIILI